MDRLIHHFTTHAIAYTVIISLIMMTLVFTHIGLKSSDEYTSTPTIEREVFSNITVDEYTECVFLIDGKRYTTHDYPCMYKAGEKVKTKLLDGIKKRIIIID